MTTRYDPRYDPTYDPAAASAALSAKPNSKGEGFDKPSPWPKQKKEH